MQAAFQWDTVILAQSAPAAVTETTLFQAPSTSRAFVEGMTICNRSGNAQSFRISASALGAATSLKDYIYFDLPIKANDTFLVELDYTMNVNDVIRIYASSNVLSFTLYGHLS